MSTSRPEIPSDPDQLRALVEELARAQRGEEKFSSTADYRRLLQERHASFLQSTRFEPGQLVKWKTGLSNRSRPTSDSVAIVVEHLEEPFIQQSEDSGGPYFREQLDLALGVVAGEESLFIVYWFDSRRFELAE